MLNNHVFEDPPYDVLLQVPSHGIHSPWNLHSFRPQTSIIPGKCTMCHGRMYPFTAAAYCVRCSCSVHRSCVLLDYVICDRFLLGPTKSMKSKGKSKVGWGVTGEVVGTSGNTSLGSGKSKLKSKSPSKKVQVAHAVVTPIVTKVLSDSSIGGIVDTQGLISSSDVSTPTPGSKDCIWRKALRSLAKQFNLSRTLSLPEDPKVLETFIISLISDSTSFPGLVCQTLRAIYLELKFQDDHNALAHARECLDNISCAVLTVLPVDIGQDKDKLLVIVNAVDRKVLSTNDNAMYEKVWNAARRLEAPADARLREKMFQLWKDANTSTTQIASPQIDTIDMTTASPKIHIDASVSQSPAMTIVSPERQLETPTSPLETSGWASVDSVPPGSAAIEDAVSVALNAVGSALTAMDKLQHLVAALRAVARNVANDTQGKRGVTPLSTPRARGMSIVMSFSKSNSRDVDPQLPSPSQWSEVKSAQDEMCILQDMNVDADTLMQRFTNILVQYEFDETEVQEAPDEGFGLMLRSSSWANLDVINRTTRSTTMPSSSYQTPIKQHTVRRRRRKRLYWHAECNFIASLCRENDWLLGAEGYAMVTLQQALIALCPNRDMEESLQQEIPASSSADTPDCIPTTSSSESVQDPSPVPQMNGSPEDLAIAPRPKHDDIGTAASGGASGGGSHTDQSALSVPTATTVVAVAAATAATATATAANTLSDSGRGKGRQKPLLMSPPLVQRRAHPLLPADTELTPIPTLEGNIAVPADSE